MCYVILIGGTIVVLLVVISASSYRSWLAATFEASRWVSNQVNLKFWWQAGRAFCMQCEPRRMRTLAASASLRNHHNPLPLVIVSLVLYCTIGRLPEQLLSCRLVSAASIGCVALSASESPSAFVRPITNPRPRHVTCRSALPNRRYGAC